MYHWCYKIVKGDLVLQMGKLNGIHIQINCKRLYGYRTDAVN